MSDYAKPRGTQDLLPDVAEEWRVVEDKIRQVCAMYHFREIRTPIFEHTEVFERGVGDTTDIVRREMYTFSDRQGRSLTLRPEGTAGVVRAFVEQKLYGGSLPAKLFYNGPMFRYEKPQAGRWRQLHQYGVEVIGASDPRVDAEVIELADRLLRTAGVRSMRLELNSVGCPVCREAHKNLLLAHLAPVRAELCVDCQERFEKNPLRILDCKKDRDHPVVKTSPMITDHLCGDCRNHFQMVQTYLDDLSVPYEVNPNMVRGLDYYTQTAFEFIEDSIGAQSTILGGGRYNGLVRMLGGPELSGIGFAGGMERLLLARAACEVLSEVVDRVDAYVIPLGDAGNRATVRALKALRDAGLTADADYTARGIKAQMKTADRLLAKLTVIIGDDEAASGQVMVRNMETQEQIAVPEAELAGHALRILAH